MTQVCVIYDLDENYASKLIMALNEKRGVSFNTALFTEFDALSDFAKEKKMDVLVVDKKLVNEKLKEIYDGRMVILSEDIEENTVYRYQSSEKIIREIIGEKNLISKNESRKCEVIGVYSLVNYVGKTSLSLAIAKSYAGIDKKILYLNLERFSGLKEILVKASGGDLSDFLYMFKENPEILRDRLTDYIANISGLNYIAPVACAEDIAFIKIEEWVKILGFLGEYFEIIVVDISNAILNEWKLLDLCIKIYMPVREDYISVRKVEEFKEYLISIGKEILSNQIEEILIPRDKTTEFSKDFFENVDYSKLGRYAKDIINN